MGENVFCKQTQNIYMSYTYTIYDTYDGMEFMGNQNTKINSNFLFAMYANTLKDILM